MSPVTVFFRTLRRASAIFIGVAAMFLHPPLEWRAASQGVVGAQQAPSEAAVDGLIGLLKDPDVGVRRQAVSSLAELGNARAVPALGQAINDQEPDVRWNAAISLAGFGDRRAVGPLKEMLDRERLARVTAMREDQKEDAMIVAMTAYTRLVGKDANSDLQRIADADPSLRVRAAAKSALVAAR